MSRSFSVVSLVGISAHVLDEDAEVHVRLLQMSNFIIKKCWNSEIRHSAIRMKCLYQKRDNTYSQMYCRAYPQDILRRRSDHLFFPPAQHVSKVKTDFLQTSATELT